MKNDYTSNMPSQFNLISALLVVSYCHYSYNLNTQAVFTLTHIPQTFCGWLKQLYVICSFISTENESETSVPAYASNRPAELHLPDLRTSERLVFVALICSCQQNNIPALHQRNSSHFKTLSVSVWFMGLSGRDFPLLWLCHGQSERGGLQRVTVGCAGRAWWMSPSGQKQHSVCADPMWGVVISSRTCLPIRWLPEMLEVLEIRDKDLQYNLNYEIHHWSVWPIAC